MADLESILSRLIRGNVKGIGSIAAVEKASEEVETQAGTCRILTLDGIIAAKRAMNRDRDRQAVLQLEAIRERRATPM